MWTNLENVRNDLDEWINEEGDTKMKKIIKM